MEKIRNLESAAGYIAFFELFVITNPAGQFTWYTCSCGQILNFFVEDKSLPTHRSKTPGLSTFLATVVSGREHPQRHADFVGRVHPDGTRTSHTLPLPPFASPARALVANKHQHRPDKRPGGALQSLVSEANGP